MVDKNNNKLENNIILNSTELTGIVGKNEMNKLSKLRKRIHGRNIGINIKRPQTFSFQIILFS